MQPREMSVTLPVGQAMDRVKKVLFQPFDVGRWFVIGFCAWLAYLGEGGGFTGGLRYGGHHGQGQQSIRDGLAQARDYVMHNLVWIAPLAIALILVSAAIWLIVMWLSSRGRFMFLHCVAVNAAEARVPWARYSPAANSLFIFRLLISLIGLVVMLPLVGGLLLVVMRMVFRETVSPGGLLLAVMLAFVIIAVGIVFWIIGRLTTDFVVPLQFLRRSRCLDAWRELSGMLRGNLGNIVLYFLFRIVLAMAIAVVLLGVVLVTCCIAGCLFALPYLGTVFLLPILVFDRAYSLHYLAQL
ncbi:MAG: hypothetical protein NT154_28260, partial [Verrucomicrobia bacterium]|nr:hypothetical protein [Verrucomicrobiota bacterium]